MLPEPLIAPDQHWLLLAALCSVAALAQWAERTRWGGRLSAAVMAILGALVLSNLSLIPSDAPVYGVVWSYLVPLAIPLLLLKADLKRIVREAGPTLAAFALGGVGTVLGTALAYALIPLGQHGWRLAGIFCATYIGGSMNYVAAAEALQLKDGALLSAGVAADNLVMTVYFLLLFALPGLKPLARLFRQREPAADAGQHAAARPDAPQARPPGLGDLLTALALSTGLCAVGFWLAEQVGVKGTGILFITAMTVALATAAPRRLGRVAGADMLGTLLMQLFFAAIGASANVLVVLKVGPLLFIFAGLILLVHLLFLLVGGKLLGLALDELIIASNANMGGPTTAAAMAVARGWQRLVIPAILCGTLGYAVATFIGAGVGYWLQP